MDQGVIMQLVLALVHLTAMSQEQKIQLTKNISVVFPENPVTTYLQNIGS